MKFPQRSFVLGIVALAAIFVAPQMSYAQCRTSKTVTFAVAAPVYSVPTTPFATGDSCTFNSTATYSVPTTVAVPVTTFAFPAQYGFGFQQSVHVQQFRGAGRFRGDGGAQVQQRGLINFNGGLLGLLRGSGQSANQSGILNFN